MPGTNEVVMTENKWGRPISVEEAFKFVRSDDRSTKHDGDNYIPSNKLYIDCGNGQQIPIKEARRFTRSEMMILEMLQNIAKDGWKRPIYFACTVGSDYYLGLEPYFEITGLANRITPYRSPDGQPRVNTELMYENMMHKFRYGNMNQPGIWIDENLMRMCRTHRMMFAQLAEALIRENQRDKALEVLNYAEEVLPEYNIPYETTSITMAQLYRYLDENEKADYMLQRVAQNSLEYLQWGQTLSREQRKAAESLLQQHQSIYDYVNRLMR